MKLGKLFVAELAAVAIILVLVVAFVEVNPELEVSSNANPIGAFKQKLFDQNAVIIAPGQSFTTSFDYYSYEPAVLLIDFSFSDVQSPGFLGCICNGRYLGAVYASQNSHTSLSSISLSGAELVKPPSAYADAYSNQIIFTSDTNEGFAGTFAYQINLKGTR